MKRLLSLATILLVAISSFAYYDAKIGGIYYLLWGGDNASVTSYSDYYPDNKYAYSGNVIIPEKVTYNGKTYNVKAIANYAFMNCSQLMSVTIPSSVTSIGTEAFRGCTSLTSVTIPSSITSINSNAFENCTELKEVIIPDGNLAKWSAISFTNNYSNPLYFAHHLYSDEYTEITELNIPEGTTSIGKMAFYGCTGISSVTIPSSVTSIGSNAFYGCTGLTNVVLNSNSIVAKSYSSSSSIKDIFGTQVKNYVIGGSVTNIGYYAFGKSSNITSVTISEGVQSISSDAFYGCSGLTSITIPSSVTTIGSYAFLSCSGLTAVTLTEGVWSIGESAFSGCTELTSIDIPSSVRLIGMNAFSNTAWYNKQPDGVIYAGNFVYDYKGTMSENTSISLREGTVGICDQAFAERGNLSSIIFPSTLKSIGKNAFVGCGLTNVTIPSNVAEIYDYAFSLCNMTSLSLLSDDMYLGSGTFPKETKLYVKNGSNILLRLWDKNYTNIYDIETSEPINLPSLSLINATQTTLEVKINNMYGDYKYEYEGNVLTGDVINVKGLQPNYSKSFRIYITLDKDYAYSLYENYTTLGINPVIVSDAISASSFHAKGSYTKGDATIVKEMFKYNNKEVDGENIIATGLTPNTSYEVTYSITVAYGDNNQYTASYTDKKTVKTQELTLTTEQPKVVSMGNVVVSATTNVDEGEKNVGFEWRRTDWTSDFASNSGSAVIFDGTMEGYIRNMNTDKLWKYRAYYLSDAGVYYYGDWVGLDASNTSYFEPTVHTYADISTTGNVALIRGYVLNGTDKIKVQGFKYWKTANKGNSLDIDMEGDMQTTAIPADAIIKTVDIVGSGQQLMNATLEGLDYDATYHCVAFATTTENETFYGEEQMFTTESITGIEGVKESAAGSSKAVTVVAYYDLNGKRLSQPQKGLNIIRMSDGTTRKVVK